MNADRTLRLRPLYALLAASAWGCASQVDLGPPEFDERDVQETAENLQLGHIFLRGSLAQVHSGNLSTTPMSQATGALRLTNPNPGMPHASCGATFVSWRHAVTAAHCVDHLKLNTDTFEVQQIFIANQTDSSAFNRYTAVTGSWPDWRSGQVLNASHGYNVLSYRQCTVRRRCGHGRANCPISQDPDIALIRCDDRPKSFSRTWAHTAWSYNGGITPNIDNSDINVNIWWFHEVYLLPPTDDGTERWDHYGPLTSPDSENWHYARKHQLLPLVSVGFPNGTPFSLSAWSGMSGTTNTIDAPACNGTSGAGVFAYASNLLLGPAVTGGRDSVLGSQLCDRFDQAQPNQLRTNYIKASLTDAFVKNSPEILADRPL